MKRYHGIIIALGCSVNLPIVYLLIYKRLTLLKVFYAPANLKRLFWSLTSLLQFRMNKLRLQPRDRHYSHLYICLVTKGTNTAVSIDLCTPTQHVILR